MADQYETKVVFYKSQALMQQQVEIMQAEGWEVISSEVVKGDYKAGKTCCLGCLFLPLALLGKGEDKFKVQYRREIQKA